jgi:hypothetical protein
MLFTFTYSIIGAVVTRFLLLGKKPETEKGVIEQGGENACKGR